MALDREKIALAIEERLRAALDVPTITRSVTEFRNAPASQRPSVLLLCGDEDAERNRGQPPTWTLRPTIHVYARNDKSRPAPDTQLNECERAIEAAFEAQAGEVVSDRWLTTLGGLVARCWVVGTQRVQGEAQHEAELRVDLEILAVGP